MDFGTAVNTCLRKYVAFDGRATRPEFWFFVLFAVILSVIAGVLDATLFFFTSLNPVKGLVGLLLVLPLAAATVRRLHDTGKTGWLALLYFIPVIGGLILIFFLIQPTQMIDNEFGPVANPVPRA